MSHNEKRRYFDSAATTQLKEYYQSHDFTGHIVGYNASNSTPERDRLFSKAKKFCAFAWIDQLSAIGVKYRQKNYSESYPLRRLSDANGDYIAGQVADIMGDPKKFDAILDTFFAQLQPVLDAGFTSLANSLKKSVEELTEKEHYRHENFVPAIVSRETWEQAQFLLKDKMWSAKSVPGRTHRITAIRG